jgi:hypothetical protein
MGVMVAFCGLECETCPIHLATLEQDEFKQRVLRESIAEQAFKLYGLQLLPKEITDCDGCRAGTGRLFSGCSNCEIKRCAAGKNIATCADCDDFACEKLREHFAREPDARRNLERLRKARKL